MSNAKAILGRNTNQRRKEIAACLALAAVLTAQAAQASHKPAKVPVQNAVPAPTAPAPVQQQLPSPEVMVILIRSSIIALGQANTTNNYSVLNQLGSPNFRVSNPPQRLMALFQSFRTNNIDLSPVVYLNPQLTSQPSISNGKLHLVGLFPSNPLQVNFDLTYEPDQGIWKLAGLGVNLTQAPPVAQSAAPQR